MGVKSATAFGLSSGLEPGLVLLNTTSFSGVTAQAISSVFSSTYRHYKIIGSITSVAANTQVKLRLRSGLTDNTSTVYASGLWEETGAMYQELYPELKEPNGILSDASAFYYVSAMVDPSYSNRIKIMGR